MKAAVAQAIEEIRAAFQGHAVESDEDSDGGAFVRVHETSFGEQMQPKIGWVTFHIVYTYPAADIYPHFVPGDLRRLDGQQLGEGFHAKEMKLGRFQGPATMVSRRSKRWDPAIDTAAIKLAKVLDWIRKGA